ncbi:MAG: RNA polymerase sigma factor [Acidobacteriota bacterium]|nr:MAG: RNA polymerase sigma factor [Acidobacteriota bacterium]
MAKTESSALDARLGELLSGLAPDDLGALNEIYELLADELYALALWRTASTTEAEDAVQEVFVRLAQRAGSLTYVRRPRVFLLTLAHRAAVDQVRARRRAASLDELPELIAEEPRSPDRLDAERARHALAKLPAKHRTAVYLRHYAGLTFSEISRVTGAPTFTAASRYRLGLTQLRKRLGVD